MLWRALLLLALVAAAQAAASPGKRKMRVEDAAVFREVDDDHDGQLELDEIRNYIAQDVSGADFDTASEVERGVAEVFENIGNNNAPNQTVGLSSSDLEAYWDRLCYTMTTQHISEWVEHAVQLPQFVDNFRRAAITGCDLKSLDAHALEHDLGIASQLHRKQLTRAISMKLLAVGDEPNAPSSVRVDAVACDAARVAWSLPAASTAASTSTSASASSRSAPTPTLPVHRYVLQRRRAPPVQRAAGGEATAAVPLTLELEWQIVYTGADAYFVDALPAPGDYEYRVRAWNLMGASPYAVTDIAAAAFVSLPCSAATRGDASNASAQPSAWADTLYSLSVTKLIATALVIGATALLMAHLMLPDTDVFAALLAWLGLGDAPAPASALVSTPLLSSPTARISGTRSNSKSSSSSGSGTDNGSQNACVANTPPASMAPPIAAFATFTSSPPPRRVTITAPQMHAPDPTPLTPPSATIAPRLTSKSKSAPHLVVQSLSTAVSALDPPSPVPSPLASPPPELRRLADASALPSVAVAPLIVSKLASVAAANVATEALRLSKSGSGGDMANQTAATLAATTMMELETPRSVTASSGGDVGIGAAPAAAAIAVSNASVDSAVSASATSATEPTIARSSSAPQSSEPLEVGTASITSPTVASSAVPRHGHYRAGTMPTHGGDSDTCFKCHHSFSLWGRAKHNCVKCWRAFCHKCGTPGDHVRVLPCGVNGSCKCPDFPNCR